MPGERLRGALVGVASAVSFLTTTFAAAYLLTDAAYRQLGWAPPPFLAQIANQLLGLLLAFLAVACLSRIFHAKRVAAQMGAFGPIIDALDQIAKGDFTVRLDHHVEDGGLVGTLVKRVNTVALELNQIEAMRQEFVSNVSHEIQSPLTSICGFARALHNDALSPAERSHYLTIIETESMRLSKLSANMLALAALDAERRPPAPRRYRLDRQVRDLILACEPQWAGKAIDMEVDLAEASITASEDLLGQVWVNLLHNSIKFTPEGGRVCVGLRRCDGGVELRVADSGVGISPDDLPRVFERFFKADAARERSRGGSGLGLAIAKRIVDLHRGRISAQSAPGAGATFTVYLPAEEA